MPRDLTNRPIIITGASSGIGAATCIACARAGMNVVINARREERLQEVADKVRSLGRQAKLVVGDATDMSVIQRLLETCRSAYGRVDVVFANAGYGLEKSTLKTSDEELRGIFDVNFFASVDLCRTAATHMIERGDSGHLLMCSSCLAKFTLTNYGAYSATKAAQNHICRAMNLELESHGICVSSVHPITTTTEFFETAAARSGTEAGDALTPEHAPKLFVQPPERVARAIVKCLRRPRPEVWTSMITRATAAVGTMFPRFMDFAVRGR